MTQPYCAQKFCNVRIMSWKHSGFLRAATGAFARTTFAGAALAFTRAFGFALGAAFLGRAFGRVFFAFAFAFTRAGLARDFLARAIQSFPISGARKLPA